MKKRIIGSHPPAKPHAMDHLFIGRDQDAAWLERAAKGNEHK
jgi:hypothetical protein